MQPFINRSTILAGILASVTIVLFMMIVPQLLGMNAIDITRETGLAFNSQSPYIAGIIALGLLGIIDAGVFAAVYRVLPGNYLVKGAVFGLLVGLFSLTALPIMITSVSGILGTSGQYQATAVSLDNQTIISIVAYVVFGLTLAFNYQPDETQGTL